MPFVPREELERLRVRDQQFSEIESQMLQVGPLLEIAGELHRGVVRELDDPSRSTDEIFNAAYEEVRGQRIHEARQEVVARYARQHRESLYRQVMQEVVETEGESLFSQAVAKIEGDPDLMMALRKDARDEVMARSKQRIEEEITEEQKAILEAEAERQLQLDRFDVRLAMEGSLDINSASFKKLIKPGDQAVIFFNRGRQRKQLIFKWIRDVNQVEGWIFVECNEHIFTRDGYGYRSDAKNSLKEKFITIGSAQKDLVKGGERFVPDQLIIGEPLHFSTAGKPRELRSTDRLSNGDDERLILEGTDFRTKELNFT